VVGGGQIYEGALAHPACTTLYVTRLAATFACDAFFPPFEHAFARAEVMATHDEAGIAYTIERWQRR
jgi:dihydrofolate reductase